MTPENKQIVRDAIASGMPPEHRAAALIMLDEFCDLANSANRVAVALEHIAYLLQQRLGR